MKCIMNNKLHKSTIKFDGGGNYELRRRFVSYTLKNLDTGDVSIIKVKGSLIKSRIIFEDLDIVEAKLKSYFIKQMIYKYKNDTFIWSKKSLLKNNELFMKPDVFSFFEGIMICNFDERYEKLFLRLLISYKIVMDNVLFFASILIFLTIT